MSGANASSEVDPAPCTSMALRTYSRRGLKRRLTSPSRRGEKIPRRARSLEATTSETVNDSERIEVEAESNWIEAKADTNKRRDASLVDSSKHLLSYHSANSGRKRMKFSASECQKTPTELFLEHLGSSTLLTQQIEQQARFERDESKLQDDQLKEVVLLSTEKDDAAEADEIEVAEADEGDAKLDTSLEESALEQPELKSENPESDEDDDDFGFTPSVKTKVKRYTLLSLSAPVNQRSTSKGRFHVSVESPRPTGFKKLPKVQSRFGAIGLSHEQELVGKPFKVTKSTQHSPFKDINSRSDGVKMCKGRSDGFTNEEARPTAYRRPDRRVKNIATELNSLDLTQKGVATQKIEGPTWPRGQKRSKPATTTSLWRQRQALGPSQFQIESQDPLDTSDDKKELKTELEGSGYSKHSSSQISDTADENLDLPEHGSETNEPLGLLEFPDYEEHEENGAILLTIPWTDTPEPVGEDALADQLPPKQMLGVLDYGGDRLRWRV